MKCAQPVLAPPLEKYAGVATRPIVASAWCAVPAARPVGDVRRDAACARTSSQDLPTHAKNACQVHLAAACLAIDEVPSCWHPGTWALLTRAQGCSLSVRQQTLCTALAQPSVGVTVMSRRLAQA